jgi:hypothetical protein|tara:strand:+ start:421 stop:723 length:303 start_codon:yes stop_codon:yes gene_type:complete
MSTYRAYSPWHDTNIVNERYLDILSIRSIPAESDDIPYVIQEQYTHRPDLLAHDIYENHNLWWVFAQRNMNVLIDPIYDFEAGVRIFLPKPSNLKQFMAT